MWKLKALKHRRVRTSAEIALAGSAGSPDSGVQALDNSHGSSAAASELLSSIGFALEQFDCDKEPGDFLRLQLERLAIEAMKYQNCRVNSSLGEEWKSDPAVSRLLYAACLCSARVYDIRSLGESHDIEISRIKYNSPSIDGTLKATAFWTFRDDTPTSSNRSLIVSIRGSATAADHIVNLNDSRRDTQRLFWLDSSTPVYAHAGFLNSAGCLLPSISKEIARQLAENPSIANVVFTGHSAGGAVASLVFLHFVHQSHPALSSKTLSLVTFGSAPVLSQSITKSILDRPNIGLMLAVVNENDMVTRADGPYIRSIVDLYRSKYGPPIAYSEIVDENSREPRESINNKITPEGIWSLPPPVYHLVGDIVILREQTDIGERNTITLAERPATVIESISAVKVHHHAFSRLLFCDIEVHRRRAYLERLQSLWKASESPSLDSPGNDREWLDDVLSWSETEGSLSDDFCSLFTASTFSSTSTSG